MIDKQEMDAIHKGWITLNVIWGAMLLSLLIYFFAGLYMKGNTEVSYESDGLQLFRNALYVVTAITLIATFTIRKRILKTKGTVRQQGIQTHSPAVARYQNALIVSLAMSESIGIYGLVLFFMGKNSTDLYLFITISAAAMIYYRPNKEELMELANKLAKERI